MAVKISELPTTTSVTGDEVVPIVQNGVTKGVAIGDIIPIRITPAEIAAGVTPVSLNYLAGHAYRYGTNTVPGTTDMQSAIQAAIAQSAQDGGSPAFIPDEVLAVGSSLTPISGMRLYGAGMHLSSIKALANTFSVFDDGNTARSDIEISDLTIEAVSQGSSNRGIFFDADTASQTSNVRIRRVRFNSLYRGTNIHRGTNIEFDDCVGEDLTSSLLYIGLSEAAGRSSKIRVRRPRVEGGDIVDASGGGNIIVAYADGVRVVDAELNDTGASAGSVNLYHGVYIRSCTRAVVRDTKGTGHRRGSIVTVFADVGAGETRCKRVRVSGVEADAMADYAAVRCDNVDDLTINGVQANEGHTNALYLTDINGLAVSDIQGRNNNRERLSGTQNALVRIEDVVGATIRGVTGVDDDTGSGEYGQGMLFHVAGACTDIHWSDLHFKFPSAGGELSYYGIVVAAAATLDRFSVKGFTQDGASTFFNETGTATAGDFSGLTGVNNAGTTPFTNAQLHKFRIRGVWVNGAYWPYESDGNFITARLSAAPVAGDWNQGDMVWRTTPGAGFAPGYVCTTSGTPGTWKEQADLDA